jgi:hypothetical protein
VCYQNVDFVLDLFIQPKHHRHLTILKESAIEKLKPLCEVEYIKTEHDSKKLTSKLGASKTMSSFNNSLFEKCIGLFQEFPPDIIGHIVNIYCEFSGKVKKCNNKYELAKLLNKTTDTLCVVCFGDGSSKASFNDFHSLAMLFPTEFQFFYMNLQDLTKTQTIVLGITSTTEKVGGDSMPMFKFFYNGFNNNCVKGIQMNRVELYPLMGRDVGRVEFRLRNLIENKMNIPLIFDEYKKESDSYFLTTLQAFADNYPNNINQKLNEEVAILMEQDYSDECFKNCLLREDTFRIGDELSVEYITTAMYILVDPSPDAPPPTVRSLLQLVFPWNFLRAYQEKLDLTFDLNFHDFLVNILKKGFTFYREYLAQNPNTETPYEINELINMISYCNLTSVVSASENEIERASTGDNETKIVPTLFIEQPPLVYFLMQIYQTEVRNSMKLFNARGWWKKSEDMWNTFLSFYDDPTDCYAMETVDLYVTALHQQGKTDEGVEILRKTLAHPHFKRVLLSDPDQKFKLKSEVIVASDDFNFVHFLVGVVRMAKMLFYMDKFEESEKVLSDAKQIVDVRKYKSTCYKALLDYYVDYISICYELNKLDRLNELKEEFSGLYMAFYPNRLTGSIPIARSRYLITDKIVYNKCKDDPTTVSSMSVSFIRCIERPNRPECNIIIDPVTGAQTTWKSKKKLNEFYVSFSMKGQVIHDCIAVSQSQPSFTVNVPLNDKLKEFLGHGKEFVELEVKIYSDSHKTELLGQHYQLMI